MLCSFSRTESELARALFALCFLHQTSPSTCLRLKARGAQGRGTPWVLGTCSSSSDTGSGQVLRVQPQRSWWPWGCRSRCSSAHPRTLTSSSADHPITPAEGCLCLPLLILGQRDSLGRFQPHAGEAMPRSSPQPDRDSCIDDTSFFVPSSCSSGCVSSLPGSSAGPGWGCPAWGPSTGQVKHIRMAGERASTVGKEIAGGGGWWAS